MDKVPCQFTVQYLTTQAGQKEVAYYVKNDGLAKSELKVGWGVALECSVHVT